MGSKRIRACRRCERGEDECGPISRRGYCGDCGELAVIEAAEQLRNHRGPAFETWRAAIAASVGAKLDHP